MTRGFDYCFQAKLSLQHFNACPRNWTRESITPQSSFSASRTPKTRKTFSLAFHIFLNGVLIEVFLCCQAECGSIRDRECSDPKGAAGTLLSRRIRWNGRHRACENEEEGRLCAGPHNAGKESPHQRGKNGKKQTLLGTPPVKSGSVSKVDAKIHFRTFRCFSLSSKFFIWSTCSLVTLLVLTEHPYPLRF